MKQLDYNVWVLAIFVKFHSDASCGDNEADDTPRAPKMMLKPI